VERTDVDRASHWTDENRVPGPEFRVSPAGVLTRAGAAAALTLVVFLVPVFTNASWDDRISLAAIFAIIGLSINVLTGYAGQVSLGHQAFVGIGAFMSAYMVKSNGAHASFFIAVPIAGLTGAAVAFALGLIALRIRGLYLALVTLAFGLMAQSTIFRMRWFTGGGAGAEAPRPSLFASDLTYAYLCILVLAFFLFVDWRLANSKPGRGIVAVRNNERVAATLGINVVGYKLLAFVVSGFLAGVAGSLFAHLYTSAYYQDYDFPPTVPASPLIFLMMAVVGGLGSRAGVIIGSAFFAVFPLVLPSSSVAVPSFLQFIGLKTVILNVSLTPLVGAFLLLLTVTRYPGGIGQQLLPIRRWLAGGPLVEPGRRRVPAEVGEGPAEAVAATETVMFPRAPSEDSAAIEAEAIDRVPASGGLPDVPHPPDRPLAPAASPPAPPPPELAAVDQTSEVGELHGPPPPPDREPESAEIPAMPAPPDGHEPQPAGRIGRLFGFRRARKG
jgi:branched-chain amino acid transport system permease protein